MSNKVYEIVTQQIIDLLEKGEIPWKKPWKSIDGARNLVTGKPYRGINQFILNCAPYQSPWWLTFNQIQAKSGSLRAGSKSQLIVFWKWVDKADNDEGNDSDNDSTTRKIPILRYYRVFNLDSVEGIPHPPQKQVSKPFTPIQQAEQIVKNMPLRPEIKHGGDRAYYSPMLDYVQMPNQETFDTSESYYDTLFHELSHATGHASRLGRRGVMEPSYFGSHDYSAEELCAQFTSSMVLGSLGIEQATIENSAAYIQGWLKVLKSDKKILVHAAAQAQKASDYILRRNPTEDQ